tara:strand:- start:270 stop:1160 length:891 start_codon:yes stop_codon:yes gene_type:complete
MKNKPFRNLIYFLLPIFCLFCASKNEEIETNENELIELQEQIDDLEYIVKNTATGGGFSSGQPSADISEKNAADNATSIQVLKAKINYLEKELQNMMTHPGTWDNPFSIYNKKILMDNGTLYYGNIIYQDDYTVTLETLIGRLNLERNRIKRVYAHRPEEEDLTILPTLDIDMTKVEDGDIIYKKPAEIILLGNISSYIDDDGFTNLQGQVQNIGGQRADFVKVNMVLYRDWSETLPPKSFTVFVDGSSHYFTPDSTKMSNSSLEPNAIADFKLIIPKEFGTLMSWKYDIDYEQYD